MKKLVLSGLVALVILVFTFEAAKASTWMVKLCWDPSPRATGYRVYWGHSYDEVAALPDSQSMNVYVCSACIEVDIEVDDDYYSHGVFFAVTAYNSFGESAPAIGYVLWGNIIGGFNDGTPWRDAKVDPYDLGALGYYWGQSVSHPSLVCGTDFSFAAVPTIKQSADLDRNGRIDGYDLDILGYYRENQFPR